MSVRRLVTRLGRPTCLLGRLPGPAPASQLARLLLTPPSPPDYKTSKEVIETLTRDVIGGPSNYDPQLYDRQREELLAILPTSQQQLPPRYRTTVQHRPHQAGSFQADAGFV